MERNSKLLGCRVRFNAYYDYENVDGKKKLVLKKMDTPRTGIVTKYVREYTTRTFTRKRRGRRWFRRGRIRMPTDSDVISSMTFSEDSSETDEEVVAGKPLCRMSGIIVEIRIPDSFNFKSCFISDDIIDNVDDEYVFQVRHDVNKTVYEHFFKPERFENLKKWMETTDVKIDEIKKLVETNTDKIKAHDEEIAKFKPFLEEREQILKDIAKIKRDMIEQKQKRDAKIRMRSHVHMKEWGFNEKYMRRIVRLQERLNYVESQLPREVIDLID